MAVLQEGLVYIKGTRYFLGEGDGYIKYDLMTDEMCSVTIEAPVTFQAQGELRPKDCKFNLNVAFTTKAGKLYGPCTPEMPLPASDIPLYADVDAGHAPDLIVATLDQLIASVARPEPLGHIQWTANYRILDGYGEDPYDCFDDVDWP